MVDIIDVVISEYKKIYYEQNRDVISEKQKRYSEQNKDVISEWGKQYHEQNKDVISEKQKRYNVSLALYDTWYDRLNTYEECIQDSNDITYLQVKCTKCGEWFNPTNGMITDRLVCINGTNAGENRFYCSDICKDSCEIFNQVKYSKGSKPKIRQEFSSVTRKQALIDADNICQLCNTQLPSKDLDCHHEIPIALDTEKEYINDINNIVVLCKWCHLKVHSQDGCTYGQLANI